MKASMLLAWRRLLRNKFHALVNILGLSIGLGTCIVLYMIVDHELSYDHWRKDFDRVYRVYSEFSGAFTDTNPGVPTGTYTMMRDQVSGLSEVTHFHTSREKVEVLQENGVLDDRGTQDEVVLAGPSFFAMFPDYVWLQGTPEVLNEPFRVVLSDRKAKDYFGVENVADAMGRQLVYHDSLQLTVAGVFAFPERHTDLGFEDVISYPTIQASFLKENFRPDNWDNTNSNSQLFVKLAPGMDISQIEGQLGLLNDRYAEDNEEANWRSTFHLQPFSDLHFNTILRAYGRPPANMRTLYALILVSVLLLLIAAINFINLETAQAIRRAQEVGVRKVLGSTRGQLVRQFLVETFLITLIAVLLAVQWAHLAFYGFRDFIPEGLSFGWPDGKLLLFLGLLTGVTTLLAGAYPAFIMSAYRPAFALKGGLDNPVGAGSIPMRRALIVFQFVVAQALIFGAFVVGRQIHFMLDKDMGFEQEAIVNFNAPWGLPAERLHSLDARLKAIPGIRGISRHQSPPARNGYSTTIMKIRDGENEPRPVNVHQKFGDTAFIGFYGLELLAGRNLLHGDSTTELIVNETFAHEAGFEHAGEMVGETVFYNDTWIPVVGVVKDFHHRSLHNPIEPTAIGMGDEWFRCYALKLPLDSPGAFEKTMKAVEDAWKDVFPDNTFEYAFLDEELARFYRSERRTARLVRTGTLVAIFLSCLGLLGLVSYSATQRTREIGIRKVLGASVASIVGLLTKDFFFLVLIASAIALPLAWLGMNRWLDDFAFRIDLQWWMVVVAALMALAFALFTVSLRALAAARRNPAEALKYE